MDSTNDSKVTESQTNVSTKSFQFSTEPTLEDIRTMQAKFVEERNWDQYHQPRNLLLALMGEVGELSEIFQWKGEVQPGLPNWSAEEKEHVAQELSDIVCYLVRLADKCQVDLPKAVVKKIAANAAKYPAQEVWGDSRKYNEYGSQNKPHSN